MSMLIEEYKNYKENGIEEPEAVIKFTKEYRKAQDSILQFIDKFIKHKEPDNKLLGLSVIYNEFKYWHSQEFDNKSKPSRTQFRDYMNKQYGKMKRGGWGNIELIKDDPQEKKKLEIIDFDDDDETSDEIDPLDKPVSS